MKLLTAEYLRRVGTGIFTACGAPPNEAAIVAEELVEASLMGLDSHGVMRFVQYAEEALEGRVQPGVPLRIVKETPSTAIVDCGFNFGPVSARHMADIVAEKGQQSNVACVIGQNSNHVGRLGTYAQRVAAQGLVCLAAANSSKHGHWVVPWGGREGRLATNPLAFAAPTRGQPVVLDMSTAMIAEGKIRLLMQQGESLPPDCIQDAQGNRVTDPKAFYGPPHGTIMPFGSQHGYKGFGLGLLVEVLGGILAGAATSVEHPYVNGLCLIAINPEVLCGLERFKELMDDLCTYMTTTPPAPGFSEVVMPGTYEFRARDRRLAEGIPVADETWRQIVEMARRVGVII